MTNENTRVVCSIVRNSVLVWYKPYEYGKIPSAGNVRRNAPWCGKWLVEQSAHRIELKGELRKKIVTQNEKNASN